MDNSIKWLSRPKRLCFERISWQSCPEFIRKAFPRWKPLYQFTGDLPLRFVFDERWLFHVQPGGQWRTGPICDLASIPWWIPPPLVSRNTETNHLDIGALVHDLIHLGCATFPGISKRRHQARLADAVMVALWRDCLPDESGWWKRTRLTRKHWGVRAAAPILFRPDPANLKPEWITITDLQTEKKLEVDHA